MFVQNSNVQNSDEGKKGCSKFQNKNGLFHFLNILADGNFIWTVGESIILHFNTHMKVRYQENSS